MFQLRPFQTEALQELNKPVSDQNHLICVAPTGSGKSLIYERAATQAGRRVLLITPLVALARQQYQKLKNLGVSVHLGAGSESEGPPPTESGAWIVSPETLNYSSRQTALKRWSPNLLVVDECHCLWEWGENFRPAFSQIPGLLEKYSIPQSLWLTATLPYEARLQLRELLPQPLKEIGDFQLPSRLKLWVQRVSWEDRTEALVHWIRKTPGTGIIFVSTREATQRVSRIASALGKKVVTYHGGMSSEERKNIESLILNRVPEVIVATSAFGMGMDYSHLTYVILWQAPTSLLSLVQIIGRVGRSDATEGQAIVFWDTEDFRLLEWTLQGSSKRKDELLDLLRFLNNLGCRREALKYYFDRMRTPTSCNCCDFCSVASL